MHRGKLSKRRESKEQSLLMIRFKTFKLFKAFKPLGTIGTFGTIVTNELSNERY